jgi:hypothetical protein
VNKWERIKKKTTHTHTHTYLYIHKLLTYCCVFHTHLLFCTVDKFTYSTKEYLQYLFVYTLAFVPRPSSAPNRGFTNVNGHRQRNADNYPQQLVRSPSQGNNFVTQSNNSTFTNPIIARDQFFQNSYSPSISSTSSPPPPPPPSIPPPPPPPPLPAHFLTNQSSPWSTLQLPASARKERSRSNTNPCKFSKWNSVR